MVIRFRLLLPGLAAFLLGAGLFAQTNTTGAIAGNVLDSSGASIPAATVTASSIQNGTVFKAQTQANGNYIIPLLQPGTYRVVAGRTGFQTSQQGPVTVAVATTAAVNFKLGVGSAAQTVEVTGEAALLQPENANTTTTLDAHTIENLPNPGNDLTFLAQVAPGAVITKGAISPSYIAADYNGLPGTGVNFTVDGASYNDPFLGINMTGPTNLSLGQNSIEEVSVNTNSFSVDQGRSEAGQINYVSKHGTNQYHGNASWQWNGRVLNAYDTFVKMVPVTASNPLPQKPFDNVNTYAASVGGPILHSKLFFFVDDEGTRIDLPEVLTNVVQPTAAFVQYAGQQMALGGCETSLNYFVPTPGAATGNCAASAATQPSVGNGNYLYLPPATGATAPAGVNELPFQQHELSLYKNITGGNGLQVQPLATLGCPLLAGGVIDPSYNPQLAAGQKTGDTNLLPNDTGCATTGTFTGTNLSWENKLVARGDWTPNGTNSFWFNYTSDRGLQATGLSPINPVFNEDSFQPEWSSAADWTRVLSDTVVNDFNANVEWYGAPFEYANEAAERAAAPVAVNTPWNSLGSTSTPQSRNVTNWALVDDLSIVHGAHQFKLGENLNKEDITDYDFQGSALTPSISAGSFAEFTYGVASSGSLAFPVSTDQPVRIFSLDVYGGDTWQVARRLTFIYGLRATANTDPKDTAGLLGNPTDFEVMDHALGVSPASAIFAASKLWNHVPLIMWQPRLAFSYQLMANTIVRGGYGLFSQTPVASAIDSMARNEPFDPSFTAGYSAGNQGAIPPNQGANGCSFAINGGGAICGDYFDPGQALSVVAATRAAYQGFKTAFANQVPSCAAFSGAQPTGTCIPVNGITVQPQAGLNAPYAEEWNFGVQRQFGQNTSLDVTYAGNRSLHNSYTVDPNAYETLCSGCFVPIPYSTTGAAGSPDPRFTSVNQARYNGYTTYNALQASFRQRVFHGLTMQVNYNWAHGLSTGTPYNDTSSLRYTYRDTAGLPFHTLSANYIYNLPWQVHSRWLGELANGWQLSGATFVQSGDPISITGASVSSRVFQATGPTTTAYVANGVAPYLKTPAAATTAGHLQWLNPAAFASAFDAQTRTCVDPTTLTDAAANNPSVCQFPATNAVTLWGPRFNWTNFFLTKSFQLTEATSFRFDVQAYNLFNHPNYAQPRATAPTVGQPSTYTNAFTISSLAHPADGLLGNGLGGDSAPRMIAFEGRVIF
ncbi:MAG: carboxypeptidase regulatory-like domain-containing protein [Terriglobales bacterium]